MERRRRRPEREYRERRYPEQRYPERRYPERRYPEERAPRRRKTTVGDVLRMLLMIAALCVFCFSAYQLYGFYQEYKAGTDEYSGLENEYAAGEETEDLAALEEAQTVSGQEMVTVVDGFASGLWISPIRWCRPRTTTITSIPPLRELPTSRAAFL